MALIKITPSSLRDRAKEVRTRKQEFDDTMGKLKSLVAALGEEWQGEAQTAFENDFENMKRNIESFSQCIEQYAKAMDTAANELEQADQNLKSKMSGSTVG